jgi:hypothetical protein
MIITSKYDDVEIGENEENEKIVENKQMSGRILENLLIE